MKKRSFGQFISGAVLGGALALAGASWAHSGESGKSDMGGMMGMHKMMTQCSQMMEDIQSQNHQSGNPES